MAEYEELVSRVKAALAKDEDIKITAADIEHFTAEQIDNIQNIFNEYSLNYIDRALENKLIDREAADYLRGIYGDAMETYRTLYKNITATLLKEYRPHKIKRLAELGEEPAPDEINAIDLDTGIVEENQMVGGFHNNMSKYKEYRAKHITPFTNMRLTFYDFRDNPVYVILPGLKNIRRAIDKIKMPVMDKNGKVISEGGKYYKQYSDDAAKIRLKHTADLRLKYGENTGAYRKALAAEEASVRQEIAALPKPYERLKDMVRMTITRKYYTDTVETLEMFKNDSQYNVSIAEIKDSFYGNISDSKIYNQKNYREKRAYLNMKVNGNSFKVETQIKITKLYEGDIDTHAIYAGEENAESRNDNVLLITSKHTAKKGLRFWEENLKRFKGTADRLIAKMNIFKLQLAIQKRNKEAIRAYNLQVLDKAFRIEDAKLANDKKFDSEVYSCQTRKNEKIFSGVADFISKNFMYRPFKAFDMSQAFNVTDDELKSLGLLVTSDQIQDFAERYSPFIMEKYNGRITGSEAHFFAMPLEHSTNKEHFAQDAWNERPLDTNVPTRDELEVLSWMEGGYRPSKKNIYKTLDKNRRNYHNKQRQAQKHNAKRAWGKFQGCTR